MLVQHSSTCQLGTQQTVLSKPGTVAGACQSSRWTATLSGCTGPGKDLVHSRSACRRPLQGDPPGYWLLERAQTWVESEGGRFGRKEDWRQSQGIASRKVAGSNLGAGKVFSTLNLR